MHEGIGYTVFLIAVDTPPISLKMKAAETEGSFVVDPGKNAFAAVGVVLPGKSSSLECKSVSIEQRIELVERKRGGTRCA